MAEVKYSLNELSTLLKVGLRNNMLINTDSPFHDLAKEVYDSTLDNGNPLSNKFYKNMKIKTLQNHTNIATDNMTKRSFDVETEDNIILIDDGQVQQTGSAYYPNKYSLSLMNVHNNAQKFKLYQDYFKHTGRISDLALMHSTGPVGIKFKKNCNTEVTVKYTDRYKDNDINCVVAVVDVGEWGHVTINEEFENKEGCKIYKILYLCREHSRVTINRQHGETNKSTSLNVIESQVVQFPNSTFTINYSGQGSLYNQDIMYIDSYKDCGTDVTGRFDCHRDSINNVVVNIHHKDVDSCSNVDVRSVLDDNSFSSFLGNIIVDDDAINVKAHLVNKNLLLSDKASAVSEPQLDINTKEIECTHGCTISNIDKDDLYYLNSKGIDNFEATEILKEAFLK